jgi:anaerobic magnesium-protoporphyrin IX monomethyl ester cyclase
MKILFIYSIEDVQGLIRPIRSWTMIQTGISIISSVLKDDGHETKLVVLGSNNRWKDNKELVLKEYGAFSPDMVCISAVSSQYPFVKKIAYLIKDTTPETFIILGGVHPTLNPDEVISGPCDALCVGEGEYPMLELCRSISQNQTPHGIANLWIKQADGKVEKNAPRPFIQDLDALPIPDRSIWTRWIYEKKEDNLMVMPGRGCTFNCTYCSNHALRKVASGTYTRFRSCENVIKELESLHRSFPQYKDVYFEVESMALDIPWSMDLCKRLQAFNQSIGNELTYRCNCHISPKTIGEDFFLALKDANFTKINMGLESGSVRVREQILKRFYSNEDFFVMLTRARKAGLKVFTFNMLGLPGETLAEHFETVALNRQCQPDMHFTCIFYPYPGTELYDLCIQKGYINGPVDGTLERRRAMIEFPQFSRSQIQKAFYLFDYHVYKGYKSLLWILIYTVQTFIRSNLMLNLVFRKFVQLPLIRDLIANLAKV